MMMIGIGMPISQRNAERIRFLPKDVDCVTQPYGECSAFKSPRSATLQLTGSFVVSLTVCCRIDCIGDSLFFAFWQHFQEKDEGRQHEAKAVGEDERPLDEHQPIGRPK